jgi:hypothetical protein
MGMREELLTEYLITRYAISNEKIPDIALRKTCWMCDNIDDVVYSFKNALISALDLSKMSVADYRVSEIDELFHCIFEIEQSINADGDLMTSKLVDKFTGEVITVIYKKHKKSSGRSKRNYKPSDKWINSSASREDTRVRYVIDAGSRHPGARPDSHGVVEISGYIHPFDVCIPDVSYDDADDILTVTIYNVSYLQDNFKKFANTKSFQIKSSLIPAEICKKEIPKAEWQKAMTSKTDFYKHHYNTAAHEYLILEPLYSSINVLAINGPNMDGFQILVRQNNTWKHLDKVINIQDNISQEVRMAENILSIR